ncbi:MAG: oligosaccharide flippase family protein [Brevinematia bacterium]
MSNIKKNYVLSTIVPILNSIFPLIVLPYVSRILGPENLGKVNFALSWVSLFITFASFGISFHGTREIAKNRENEHKLKEVFSEILLLQILTNIIVSIVYILSVFTITDLKQDIPLFLIVGLQLFLNFASLGWFFVGMEKFGYISLRNFIFKIISLIFLFLMVKNQTNYREFAFVMVFSIVGSNLLDLIFSLKYFNLNPIKLSQISKHIKPSFIFFLASSLSILYNGIDMIILQFIKPADYEKALGIFGINKRIILFALFLINSLINVNLSRSSYYIGNNNQELYQKFLIKSSKFVIFLTLPTAAITFILSKEILSIIGGSKFIEGYISLSILSLAVPVIIIRNIIEAQVLNPNGKEKFILLGSIGSFISFILLSYLTIYSYSYIGLSWIFLVAYLIDLSILLLSTIINLKILPFDKSLANYFIITILLSPIFIMFKGFITLYIQKLNFPYLISDAILIILISTLFLSMYYLINFLAKDEIPKEFIELVKKIISRK